MKDINKEMISLVVNGSTNRRVGTKCEWLDVVTTHENTKDRIYADGFLVFGSIDAELQNPVRSGQ